MRSLMKIAIFICVALTLPGCWLTDQPKKHRVSPEIFICSTKEQAARAAKDVPKDKPTQKKGRPNKPKALHEPPIKTITISFDSESHSVVVPTTLDLKKLASLGRGADIELRSDAPFSPKRGQQVVVTDADGELFYANHSPREYGREYVIHLEHIRKPANAEVPKGGISR